MIGSWSSCIRAAIAILAVVAFGNATQLVTPADVNGEVAIDVASAHEVWGAGKVRSWFHCAVSIAFAGLASGFTGPVASHGIVLAAVVGCLS